MPSDVIVCLWPRDVQRRQRDKRNKAEQKSREAQRKQDERGPSGDTESGSEEDKETDAKCTRLAEEMFQMSLTKGLDEMEIAQAI